MLVIEGLEDDWGNRENLKHVDCFYNGFEKNTWLTYAIENYEVPAEPADIKLSLWIGTEGTYFFDNIKVYEGSLPTEPSAIDNAIAESLTVYPNPATNNITISNIEQGTEVSIINTIGSIVMLKTAETESLTIDISDLKSGMYFISNGNSTTKVIVE